VSYLTSRQYVKQEVLTTGENGKEARATRLITERASGRIGQMAFELALARPRKVSKSVGLSRQRLIGRV
jgi:isocitrate/isopropylmalate dehydrogenase